MQKKQYFCALIMCAKHLKDKNTIMAEEKKSAEQEAQEQVAAAQAQAAAQQAAAQKMVEDQQKAMKKTLLISTILSFVTSIGSMLMGKFLNRR